MRGTQQQQYYITLHTVSLHRQLPSLFSSLNTITSPQQNQCQIHRIYIKKFLLISCTSSITIVQKWFWGLRNVTIIVIQDKTVSTVRSKRDIQKAEGVMPKEKLTSIMTAKTLPSKAM